MPTPSASRPTRSPRTRQRVGDDGRRLATAGHALVVCVLALAFGSLLSAPGMHKSAFNREPGVGRDVALALTGPLAGFSSALFLDRPRRLVHHVIGRESADEIDIAIELPPPVTTVDAPTATTPTEPSPPPAKPKRIVFTPERKLRIWVAGDSLVVVPGYAIVRAAAASPVIEAVGDVDGRVATGLTRPDVFNWFTHVAAQLKKLRPKVVVLDYGANDDHSYMTGLPPGVSIGAFGSPAWSDEYRRRVAGMMDTVNRGGAVVVWIGLPVTRSEAQTQRLDTINAIVQSEAKARPGKAIFVDTYTMFAGDNGRYAEYLENRAGDLVKVRADDGVHFDPAGGALIARRVLKELNRLFDLTSWRKGKQP